MGFHPVIKQLFSMIIFLILNYDACSCIISEAKSVTVPWVTLSLIFDYSGLELYLENNASIYQSDDEIVNTGIFC
jgi:hypothetical protein